MTRKQKHQMAERMTKRSADNLATEYGLDAALQGKARETNPYPKNTSLNTWWDMGWLECEERDLGIEKK